MQHNQSRRRMLKNIGFLSAGLALPTGGFSKIIEKEFILDFENRFPKPEKPITCIVLGAGNRGNVYGNFAVKYPDEMDVVGVAEPISSRKERFSSKHAIPADRQFVTWEHVFERPKFANAVIITTPDHLHHGPAMQALSMGYDLLLEKPIAQTWKQCKDILDLAHQHRRIVAVCHVLRYSPYYRKIKEELDSGQLGEIVSLQHMEPIQHIHMSHSYVRGNWRVEKETNPIILAKSCHDLDILRWWIGKNCRQIASFGSLSFFRSEHAPSGSTSRCTDGCAIEQECPYSALRIYYRDRSWLHHFNLPDNEPDRGDAILNELRNGPFGRCVYRCDNDVPDHQVCILQFDGGVTASFNMEALTHYAGRRTRIMLTNGDITGDETDLWVTNFTTRETTRWNVKENADIQSGHGGGDWGLVRDWIRAVDRQDPALLTSTLDASMESHLMGFMAEKSRHRGTVEKVRVHAKK